MKDLYERLKNAYSDNNLNSITSKIIFLHKENRNSLLQKIYNEIYYIDNNEIISKNKCFTKLIGLYHPDRGNSMRERIEIYYKEQNKEMLEKLTHIFMFDNVDFDDFEIVEESIDFEENYYWDNDYENDFVYENDLNEEDYFYEGDFERSFFNVVKKKIYGNLQIDMPTYYLEDFEIFELENSEIENLTQVA